MKSILIAICVILVFHGCSDYSENLGSGYFIRHEGDSLNDILCERPEGGEIPANVVSFDHDKNYIIAKQKPKLPQDILYEIEYEYNLGSDAFYYWIIMKKTDTVLGPLSEEEFKLARKRFSIPEKLRFK